jgi:hypothetical protein
MRTSCSVGSRRVILVEASGDGRAGGGISFGVVHVLTAALCRIRQTSTRTIVVAPTEDLAGWSRSS